MPYALCPMPYAVRPMPFANLSDKSYISYFSPNLKSQIK